MEKNKKCSHCRIVKPVHEFHKRKDGLHGRAAECKLCRKKQRQRLYPSNRAKRLAESAEWRRRNPKRAKAKFKRWWLKSRYGLTEQAYYEMFERQNFSCAICGSTYSQFAHGLAVDHNHKTGRIRGLLCALCNAAIANLQDEPTLVLKAYRYVKNDGVR